MLLSELNTDVYDRNPEVIVLVGLPGCGKSTWVKQFTTQNEDFVVISVDNVIDEFAAADGIDYNAAWKKYISEADRIMKKNLQDAYNSESSVIVDKTNLSVKSRRRVLASVPSNYIKMAIVFQLDDDELDTRLEKRKSETGKSISDNVMKEFKNNFVFPTTDEGFSEIITIEND